MMKVITWNLNYWQKSSVHDDAWAILRKEIKPDLALLQEVNPHRLQKDEYISFQPIHQAWGTAIYSRNLPLEELKIEVYAGRVVAAKLEIPSGEIIIAVSIHAPIINHRVFPYLDEIFDAIEKIVNKRTFVVGAS